MLKILSEYKRDESGQYAIMTAILAIPLLLGTSAAMDFSSATSEHKSIKDALDNAVLAAATDNSLTNSQKKTVAENHFRQNYDGRANVSLTSNAESGRVDLMAEGLIPFSVSDALGLKGIEVRAKSAAMRSEENVICVLALSTSEKQSIRITGDLSYYSPTCSVHSNSTSSDAILSESSKTPVAKSFCAAGGVKGSFSPYAKGQCLPVADPYASVTYPTVGPCLPDTTFSTPRDPDAAARLEESMNATGSHITLSPGTYCEGLTVDGVNVRFLPGDYVMIDGPLTFKNGAQATADGVTFSLSGDKARLKVETGAQVTVIAAKTGARKGLAFMEMPPLPESKRERTLKNNEIKSGSQVNVTGTIYFPTQSLVVIGEGTQLGASAPATSFIADKIELKGESGARVEVKVDHQKAGLPPIQPRAEDGAILVE